MSGVLVRPSQTRDLAAIVALNDLAFGGRAEGQIVQALHRSGDGLVSLVAERQDALVGHIQFFRIWVDGVANAVGLGPLSVAPILHKMGIGSQLVREGLAQVSATGESCVIVLGHPTYYPKFGFEAKLAERFSAPWSGPAFMAQYLGEELPPSGELRYPAAFTAG